MELVAMVIAELSCYALEKVTGFQWVPEKKPRR